MVHVHLVEGMDLFKIFLLQQGSSTTTTRQLYEFQICLIYSVVLLLGEVGLADDKQNLR